MRHLDPFSFSEVASELQDAKSWLHLSVHVDGSPGETGSSGDSKRESLLESLQLKTPACSKMLEPLVRSGLVTVADTAVYNGKDVLVQAAVCTHIHMYMNIEGKQSLIIMWIPESVYCFISHQILQSFLFPMKFHLNQKMPQ